MTTPTPITDQQRFNEHLQDSLAHLDDAFKWMTRAQEKTTGHDAGMLDCARSVVEALSYDLRNMIKRLE